MMTNAAPLPSFAVVVPVYNEEAAVGECVRRIGDALALLANETVLIVVDDGSRDGTAQLLADLSAADDSLVVLRHDVNRGYGAGLGTGVVEAHRRGLAYVLFMDSDLTNDPAYLSAFASHMAEGVDVIKASRYVPGGGTRGVPLWRSSLSRLGNMTARVLFGLPVLDCTNGFRAVRTDLLASIHLQENGFAVIMEELHRLRPHARSYAEVPNVLGARSVEHGRSSFSFGPVAMARYLKYPLMSAFDRVRERL
jgi:dolichol-phosphate mannosyltransferase